MTIKKMKKFTPEVLLSAPRRGPGLASSDGKWILFSETAYSFEKQTNSSEIRVIDVKTSETSLVTSDRNCSNACWLDVDTVALLRATDDGTTELVIGPLKGFGKQCNVAGSIDGPAGNLRITKLGDAYYGVAVSAPANPDGSMYNPKKAPKPRSNGRLYKSLFVRHWDKWITPQRNSIFYGALFGHDNQDRYSLLPLTNALKGTALESPIPPFGGTDHFDISKTGIVLVAKAPDLNPALNTKCNIYLIPLTNYLETTPTIYTTRIFGFEGAMSSPQFSSDGSAVVLLAMKENGYESDQNRILVMPDVTRPAWVHKVWDPNTLVFSPQSVKWSTDDTFLYWTAEASGARVILGRQLPAELCKMYGREFIVPNSSNPLRMSVDKESVDDFQVIRSSSDDPSICRDLILCSSTSLIDSRRYSILEVGIGLQKDSQDDMGNLRGYICNTFECIYGGPAHFGLSESQISSFSSKPSNPTILPSWTDSKIESLLIKPSGFDPSKRYPIAMLIHGGPQSAWLNAWSTRWNPAVFAEQGYVVVCPNITGSTGYGERFCNGIKENWGGDPYHDLENVFSELESVPWVDTSRAVALGGSYGGYMTNWIQGHPLGRKFKALVTHDGTFSTSYEVATEELYFMHRDLGGRWSDGPEVRKKYLKWDPASFTEHWATPHLIIHSEKDYRLGVADGIAAFNVLQTKGVESEFLTFPEENHWVLDPENSLVWHHTVINFINKHVGLPAYDCKYVQHGDIVQDPARPEGGEVEGRIMVVDQKTVI